MTIIAEKIAFGGKSFAKINGKSVFIPYAVPGEVLEVETVKQKNDWDEAKIIKIIEPSEFRINPPCKYYGICGGCDMMHITTDAQKNFRLQMMKDVFLQNGIELDNVQIIEDRDFNYRCRFQLNEGGLCKRESNEVVMIEECLCAENPVNEYLKNSNRKNHNGRIHIFGSEKMLGEKKIIIENRTENDGQKERITGNKNKKIKIRTNTYFSGTVQDEKNCVTVTLNKKEISFDTRGFFQSNLFVFEKVISLILENLDGGNAVLDMYSGSGSISAFLPQKFQKVILVEHNRDAVVYAEKNMAGTNHVSYGLSGKSWVENCSKSEGKIDACVIDPPRSGMEKEVLDFLCSSKIRQIAYLSCNPSTQARDCKRLLKSGYKIKKSFLCDFYPNTSHIESLLILEQTDEF